jgi:excinuclease ABC subunit C
VPLIVPEPSILDCGNLDQSIANLPDTGAVFLVRAGHKSEYLAKTTALRRRLMRVLPVEAAGRRSLNLRGVVTRVEYWLTGSKFESSLIYYALAKENYPNDYARMVKLRLPAYVKLTLADEFPRTKVTMRLGGGRGIYYGPFVRRGSAEAFETGFLDLFQLRRCQDTLLPRSDHPGCIYGEMNRCLRPCQQAVGVSEYANEVKRVADFLSSNGSGLLQNARTARDGLSEEMQFEAAAREHKRWEQIQQVLSLRDDLACDIERLYGVAVTPSLAPGAVRLWFVRQGVWQPVQEFPLQSHVSLDQRLRELVNAGETASASTLDRQEHLAILAHWRYSSWSDGEWIRFPSLTEVPYKKLVHAISRVHRIEESP